MNKRKASDSLANNAERSTHTAPRAYKARINELEAEEYDQEIEDYLNGELYTEDDMYKDVT